MKKEEDGGDELHWESPKCNMVEEVVGTSVYCEVIGTREIYEIWWEN